MEEFFRESQEIMRVKMTDYSRPDDSAFGDLHDIAHETNLTPAFIAFVHASKHWTAIRRYLSGKSLEGENIMDRLHDLQNYCAIMYTLINEPITLGIDVAAGPDRSVVVESPTTHAGIPSIPEPRIEGTKWVQTEEPEDG
jgi:hypothetical protein